MKLHLALIATQLVAGAEWFANQPVKNQKEAPFALVPYHGELLKVNEGDWLVEYPDGTLEIWNTEQIQANTWTEQIQANTDYVETTEADEDVRIGDEDGIVNIGDETAHIISAQDLTENSELADQGIKEGDVIGIPDSALINTGTPVIQEPAINTGSPLIQEPTTTASEITEPSKPIE